MIFRNPFKEIEKLMKREHNPINGYAEQDDQVEVYVEKKLDMDEIYTHVTAEDDPWDVDDVAPDTCNDKPVKVIEIGRVEASIDSKAYNPIPGGCMMQPTGADFRGTLGVVARAPKFGNQYLVGKLKSFRRILDLLKISYTMEPVILTNAHVVQRDVANQSVGHRISQPLGVNRIVGRVLWSSAFNPKMSFIDAAVCTVEEPTLISEILEVGQVQGSRPAKKGEDAHKYGSTTKYTQGRCMQENALINVRFSQDFIVPFKGVQIFTKMSDKGDSGSLIVSQEDDQAISLLFADSNTVTIGCPLDQVEKKTGVTIGN